MAPGLYCLTGTFKVTGGEIKVDGGDEEGVTIYLSGGDFEVSGGAQVNLRAPTQGHETNYAIPGMVLYMAKDNDGVITVTGNADSTYRGTVYAKIGLIEVGGAGSALGSLSSQFVADAVKVHGTSELKIKFELGEIYWASDPSYLDLYK
jgi:hypothetical protein